MRLIAIAAGLMLAALAVVTAVPSRPEPGTASTVEAEARKALDAIAILVSDAEPGTLQSTTTPPLSATSVAFRRGDQDNVIELEEFFGGCRVVWNKMPLCNVSPYLEGEIPNGMDDNGNRLIDERGLCLAFERSTVTIRLTAQATVAGEIRRQTVETAVSLR